MKIYLNIKNISKHFDGILALDNVCFSVEQGKITSLIGPNGSGKTTLFNIITGFLKADDGIVRLKSENITDNVPFKIARKGVARTFQDLRLLRQIKVIDNIYLSFQNQKDEHFLPLMLQSQKQRKSQGDYRKNKAEEILNYVGLEKHAYELAENLSYGQQKLLSLACCLTTEAELLLLDEPVAGVNPAMIEKILELIDDLKSKGKTILLIEHNMEIVMSISDKIIVLDEGRIIAEGLPEKVKNNPAVIDAYLT